MPSRARFDPHRVRQVLVNLLGNAVKFTERGAVTLRTRVMTPAGEGPTTVEFAVEDTGIGIAPDRLAAIFDPFTQADGSTSRRFGGTGLGLTISARLVELMGGRLDVDSVEGRGSVFRVTVPVDDLSEAAAAPGELSGRQVLVVDDSVPGCEALDRLAVRLGARVTVAPSAAVAMLRLEAAQRETAFDAALIDFQMPHRTGLDMLHDARVRGMSLPPVILLLAPSELAAVAAHPHAHLAPIHLHKPVRRQDLVTAIRSARAEKTAPIVEAPLVGRSGSEAVPSSRLRVLLVEDNVVNQMVAEALLEKRGFDVVVAGNGREGLEAFRRSRFDLVLMDIQMPEMDGFEALAAIRALEAGSGRRTPVVALTAHAMKEDRERCLAAGMDDYLSKPIEASRLYSIIRNVLEGPLTPA
jgi:CheY-like chemotaxis protein